MRKNARQSDIPFSADEAHRFLPWLIGIMAVIAALLLCLGLTVNGWVIDRHGSYSNHFTVNIPAGGENNAADIDKIRALLMKQPAVESVAPMGEDRLKELLKPWLGNAGSLGDLPLPTVLEVKLRDHAPPIHYDSVQNELTALHPGVELDAHERWVAAFSSFSNALQCLTGLLAALIVGGLALMIAFTSRASLKLHGKTVQLLHSIGAEDGYIAYQFQQDAFRIALYGALPGCIVAGIGYWLAGRYMAALQAPMLPLLALTHAHLALLLLLPLACGFVALLAARLSVLAQLQRVL